MYGSIVGNERMSVRKKQQRKTKSVIYIIVKPCWLLWYINWGFCDIADDVKNCSLEPWYSPEGPKMCAWAGL